MKNGYKEVKVTFSDNKLEAFKNMVDEETKSMYAFTSNIEENIPLEKNNFVMTDRVRFCSYCEFKELCDRK